MACLALPLWQLLLSGNPATPSSGQLQGHMLSNAPIFIMLLSLLPTFVWDTVKLANRFAGPMYQLRKEIRGVAGGEQLKPLRFREDDFWQDVATDFNKMLDRF